MSTMSSIARPLWLVTGMAWAVSSLILSAGPQYWDPVTPLDWSVVWVYTAAWLVFAPSVLLLGRLSSSRLVAALATVCAVASIVAGSANALEDGFAMEGLGTWYVVGFLTAAITLVPLGLAQWTAADRRLAGLSFVLFLGIMLLTGGGGLVVLLGLGAIAVTPGWFTPRRMPAAAGGGGEA